MNEKIYGYARVSTAEQNLDRQIKALIENGVNDRDIISDKASGKTLQREGYTMLKNHMLREGDTLIIKSLDRLSRDKGHIKQELEYFQQNKIRLKIIDIPTTMIDLPDNQGWVFDMINNILIEVLSSIAEQERILIKQRQREGIEIAKLKGKYLGRPKTAYPDNWIEIYSQWKNKEITANKAMNTLNLKRTTFYKLAKEYVHREQHF